MSIDFFNIVISVNDKSSSYFLKPVRRPYVYQHEYILPGSEKLTLAQRDQPQTICIYHESFHNRIHRVMENSGFDFKVEVVYKKPFYFILLNDENRFIANYENLYPQFHVVRNVVLYRDYELPDCMSNSRCLPFGGNSAKCKII